MTHSSQSMLMRRNLSGSYAEAFQVLRGTRDLVKRQVPFMTLSWGVIH